jgi:hypothetical protein
MFQWEGRWSSPVVHDQTKVPSDIHRPLMTMTTARSPALRPSVSASTGKKVRKMLLFSLALI